MDGYKSASVVTVEQNYDSESMLDFETEDAKFCGATQYDKIVHPMNDKYRLLRVLVSITAFCNSLVGTYAVSFCDSGVVVLSMGYVFDLAFLVFMVIKFYVAYYNANGILVKDRRKIARRYVRTYFLVDVSSVFPLDLLALLDEDPLRTLTFLRLNRLIQIHRTVEFFSKHIVTRKINKAYILSE